MIRIKKCGQWKHCSIRQTVHVIVKHLSVSALSVILPPIFDTLLQRQSFSVIIVQSQLSLSSSSFILSFAHDNKLY